MPEFNVIYADPPWRYDFCKGGGREIEHHYPTMALEDLEAMPIPKAENAIMFMWAPAPKLTDALRLMAAWGFEYITCAVWDKQIIGMGMWFRQQHELLLVGRCGKVQLPTRLHSSVWSVKRGEHSAKPLQVRQWITENYPAKDGWKKIELFAREGGLFQNELLEEWALFGNESGVPVGVK
jgi:N6-adenosine-specific RNA methylase IME4